MNQEQLINLIAGHRAGCKKAKDALFNFLWSTAMNVFKRDNWSYYFSWDDVSMIMLDKTTMLMDYNYEQRGSESITCFVKRVYYNALVDYYRKDRKNRIYTFSELSRPDEGHDEDTSGFVLEDNIAAAEKADDKLLRNEEKAVLIKGISLLPSNQKKVMWMLLIEKMSDKEVMEALGISAQQLYNLRYQGKTRLMEWLRKQDMNTN